MHEYLPTSEYSRDAAKYRTRRNRSGSGRLRMVLVVACCAALLTLCVSGVYAWFSQQDDVTNTFVKGETAPVIEETFTQGSTVKENVHIAINDGCIDVWVRAQVSIQWQDADGNILWDEPVAGEDYSIEWGELEEDNIPDPSGANRGWVKGDDGFFYWNVPLVAKIDNLYETGYLIKKVEVLKKYDDGRQLVVDIAAQSLEAKVDSFNNAWNASGLTAVEGVDGKPIHLIKPETQPVNDRPAQ